MTKDELIALFVKHDVHFTTSKAGLDSLAAALTAPPAAPAVVEDAEQSEKQKTLMALADRIDHEQLWRWAGMDHHKMTPEQRDRMNAGVELRRYATFWLAGRWLVIPPVGPVRYSASTLEKAVEMAQKGERRRSSTPPEGAQP